MRSKIIVGITAALSVTALYLVASQAGQGFGPLSAFLGGTPVPSNSRQVVDGGCGPTSGGMCDGTCPPSSTCKPGQNATGSSKCTCVPDTPPPPRETCGPKPGGQCGGTCTDALSVCTSKQTGDGGVSCECVSLEKCGVTGGSSCNPVTCQNPLEHCTALETTMGIVDCLCALPIVGEPNPNKVFNCTPTEFGRTRCYRASLPSTCMPGICMQQYYTGMCTGSAEGPCEMKLEDCSSNETCAPNFRFCGDTAPTCGGDCPVNGETCVNTGTSCSCRKMTLTPTTTRR